MAKNAVFVGVAEKYGDASIRKDKTAPIRIEAVTQPKMRAAAVKRYGNLDPPDRSRIKGKAASMNIGISRSEFPIIRTCSVWVKKRKV